MRAALAGAALGFAAGLAAGAFLLPGGRPLPSREPAPATAPGPARTRDSKPSTPAPDRATAPNDALRPPASGLRPDDESVPTRAKVSLDLALARIADEQEGPSASTDLILALRRDPALVADTIARFRAETDPAKLAALAAVLGRVRDPAVEALAAELARSGDRAHRIAALDIFDAFETPAAIPLAQEILARDTDPGILSAAIFALPEPSGVSIETARAVDRELARLAQEATDVETRRRAVTRLGAWGVSAEHEATLLRALRHDPDPPVRAAAAFAFEARRPSAEAVQALAATLARRDEDPDVRENAFHALARAGPLPPDARAAYDAYAAEREGGAR